MKFFNSLLAFLLVFSLASCTSRSTLSTNKQSLDFRVAAYNIRYESTSDDKAGNGWSIRKQSIADLINRHKFDIVGTQEGNAKQLAELKTLMDGYDYIGYPYGGPNNDLHNCATYYKKELFKVMDQGVFWLSPNPDTPSIGWDATDQRICQWIRFKDLKRGKEFYFFNAHFYFRYKEAREKSGKLSLEMIKKIAGDSPVVFMGDLNSTPDMIQIDHLKSELNDCLEIAETKEGPIETFPGGRFSGKPELRLDYIFVSDHFKVVDFKMLRDTYKDNRYPSDHLPVTSRIVLP